MYVDESGDPGTAGSPTKYFILSAVVIHEASWKNVLDDFLKLKRHFKERYGLMIKEEIHASEYLQKRVKFKNPISRNLRLDILKKCLDWMNSRNDISVFSVRIDKAGKVNPFEYAWDILIQRFDNTLAYKNFPGGTGDDKGMIICDNTDGDKLTTLLRKKRRYNPVWSRMDVDAGSRDIPLRAVIEDPVFRDSKHSFILQLVDVVAYFARQVYEPNKFVRQKGAKTFYGRLHNVINQHVTRNTKNYRIVEL